MGAVDDPFAVVFEIDLVGGLCLFLFAIFLFATGIGEPGACRLGNDQVVVVLLFFVFLLFVDKLELQMGEELPAGIRSAEIAAAVEPCLVEGLCALNAEVLFYEGVISINGIDPAEGGGGEEIFSGEPCDNKEKQKQKAHLSVPKN